MPRTAAAGPLPSDTAHPDYFDSLAELAAWSRTPRPPSERADAAPPALRSSLVSAQPRARTGSERGRVLVCHDYKGGYSERDDERGYTFDYFQLIDIFVYFSHRRVTCPPPGWIRAAHNAGTAILGTLIFEWDVAKPDVLELVSPECEGRKTGFEFVSTRYADMLVALTMERGFDGWLVNVEVGLGTDCDAASERQHAQALVRWLAYFTAALKAAVPGAQVIWYDAATIDGNLAHQNAVTAQNLAFFKACDGVFCNYWWRPQNLEATKACLSSSALRHRLGDVFFGLDVFGRGTYGEGGFDSWRAMHAIREASPSFSTALFAPGWTVEAEVLQHSLATPAGHARWRLDDWYLWLGGSSTPSVAAADAQLHQQRIEMRGVMRARQLAALTATSASPVPLPRRVPVPPTFNYNGPLADLPGSSVDRSQRNLAAFCTRSTAIPCPALAFYSNFSSGAGHDFFVRGEKVLDHRSTSPPRAGWTEIALSSVQPLDALEDLASMNEDDAWEGERSLRLSPATAEDDRPRSHSLYTLRLPPDSEDVPVEFQLVWKASLSPNCAREPRLSLFSLDGAADPPQPATVTSLENGWRMSTSRTTWRGQDIERDLHLLVELAAGSGTVLVGACALVALDSQPPLQRNLEYDLQGATLSWSDAVTAKSAPLASAPLAHIFEEEADGQQARYLGTTFDHSFRLGEHERGRSPQFRLVSGGLSSLFSPPPARTAG